MAAAPSASTQSALPGDLAADELWVWCLTVALVQQAPAWRRTVGGDSRGFNQSWQYRPNNLFCYSAAGGREQQGQERRVGQQGRRAATIVPTPPCRFGHLAIGFAQRQGRWRCGAAPKKQGKLALCAPESTA